MTISRKKVANNNIGSNQQTTNRFTSIGTCKYNGGITEHMSPESQALVCDYINTENYHGPMPSLKGNWLGWGNAWSGQGWPC